MFLHKKKTALPDYDTRGKSPVIHASICTGEQVAGFRDDITGKFDELMLIHSAEDIDIFVKTYRIDKEDIRKTY